MGLFDFFMKGITQEENRKAAILNQYGFDNNTGFVGCDNYLLPLTYIGGHPDRNREANYVVIGATNGRLVFFGGCVARSDGSIDAYGGEVIEHLFDIPIDSIADIQYVDATTSNTKRASVFIDWNDGRYNHLTEIRATSMRANTRANTLRNALIRMTKNKMGA